MNNNDTATAEGAATPASGSQGQQLTTQSNQWDMLAATDQNSDVVVQVTDPQFENQSVTVTCLAPELVTDDATGEQSVRINMRAEQEVTDTLGNRKAPGFVDRPRPYCVTNPKKPEFAERGLRDLTRLLVAAGLLKRGQDPKKGDVLRALGKVEGRQVICAYSTANGSKRDEETGEYVKFQNRRFAPVPTGGAGATAAGSSTVTPGAPASGDVAY